MGAKRSHGMQITARATARANPKKRKRQLKQRLLPGVRSSVPASSLSAAAPCPSCGLSGCEAAASMALIRAAQRSSAEHRAASVARSLSMSRSATSAGKWLTTSRASSISLSADQESPPEPFDIRDSGVAMDVAWLIRDDAEVLVLGVFTRGPWESGEAELAACCPPERCQSPNTAPRTLPGEASPRRSMSSAHSRLLRCRRIL
mmetsp:Transcript_153913/g.279548  ORF Transcript_153913/g.279548 Transcript_153913/m.279548 type:complete len:204 (-) Transcript_153913:592-1203(-)